MIASDLDEIQLEMPSPGVSLSLQSSPREQPIKVASGWALIGNGYQSAQMARDEGRAFRDTLSIVLAKMGVGVDFGPPPPDSERLIDTVEAQRVFGSYDDVLGLMVYPTQPEPTFTRVGTATVVLGSPFDFASEFSSASKSKPSLTDEVRLALSIFNASFFQSRHTLDCFH
jgi:hypothetical protein